MGQFAIASLAVGMITFILVYSKLSIDKRMWLTEIPTTTRYGQVARVAEYISEMLVCPFCTGFWVGLILQVVLRLDPFNRGIGGILVTAQGMSMIGSLVAFGGGRLIKLAEINAMQDSMRREFESSREAIDGRVRDIPERTRMSGAVTNIR